MEQAEMATHIVYIKDAVDELKVIAKSTSEKVHQHDVRLTKVEESGARNTKLGALGGLIGGILSGLLGGLGIKMGTGV